MKSHSHIILRLFMLLLTASCALPMPITIGKEYSKSCAETSIAFKAMGTLPNCKAHTTIQEMEQGLRIRPRAISKPSSSAVLAVVISICIFFAVGLFIFVGSHGGRPKQEDRVTRSSHVEPHKSHMTATPKISRRERSFEEKRSKLEAQHQKFQVKMSAKEEKLQKKMMIRLARKNEKKQRKNKKNNRRFAARETY